MNTTNYKQYDTRWAKLPYRYNPDNIGNNGCGEVSVCNGIIEMVSQMNQTPATMVDYCRQFACSDGTYHSGIPKMLEHYGCTEVMEHPNFASLWRELEKGNRIAIYLMDSTPAGYLKKKWTSTGHFICSVEYRYNSQNGEHEVYIKDSNSSSNERNGWMSYESSLRGACPKVWSGKLNGSPAPTPPTPTPTGKLDVDGVGGYETVKRLQEFLGLSDPDGLIGHQRKSMVSKYVPSLTAVAYSSSGGSNTVTALQKWLGLSDPDGLWGKNTSGALQRKLRDYGYFDNPQESIDGIFWTKSMRALQTALNNDFKKKTDPPTPPTPTPTTYTNVIDVSAFQDAINWSQVKASGIVGAMVRCGYRGYETGKLNEDSMFLDHIKGAYNAGLKVGVYFFTEAINYAEGKEEAEYTMKLIEKSSVTLYYPIAIDSEAQSASTERAKNLSKAQRTDAIKGFADAINSRGGRSMLYASTNWLDNKVDMSILSPIMDVWVAQYYKECQYKGKYVMWQYTSEGSVSGVKGVVDMNKCYITSASPMPTPTPQPTPTPSGGYTGSFPTEDEIKSASNQGVINRSVAWAKDIARQGFDYLMPQSAGCYFCGTTKKKAYTCMPFVTAMFAHGGGDADVLSLCKNKHSFSLRNEDADWQMLIRKGKFAYLGRMSGIDWSAIKVGDVLVQYASDDLHGHMMLYAGNNQLAEAIPEGCEITSGAKSRYARYARGESQCGEGAKNFVMRYVGTRSYMSKGDSGTAVLEWQDFLDWWSDGQFYIECGKGDGVFGSNTDAWTKKFQEAVFGKSEADGAVGQRTIQKAREVTK